MFVAVGMCFLMLTLTMKVQNIAWVVMLGVLGSIRNKHFNCFCIVEKSKLLSILGGVYSK
ncbi:hypothetical protein CN502_19380 [Bacillus cereus]|nr:hypothetical protein CN502_19380 [Bacillus cereus]